MSDPGPSYLSASEIADYAYCPRSHWYRRHPPPGGATASSQEAAWRGGRRHDAVLRAEERRADRGALYYGLLAIGLLLLIGAVWLLH